MLEGFVDKFLDPAANVVIAKCMIGHTLVGRGVADRCVAAPCIP
jgi:hypothetical protein